MKRRIIGIKDAEPQKAPEIINKSLSIFWVIPKKESSQIAGYAYDYITKTLALKFHKGGIFTYENIPNHLYESLVKIDQHHTESLGSWLSLNITRGKENQAKYPFTKEN